MPTTISKTIRINASMERVFSLYADIASWKSWDPEVAEVNLTHGLTQGSTGYLRPKKGPGQKITISEVKEGQSFTASCRLPLCQISFVHELSVQDLMTVATHSVSFSGPLSGIFGKLIGGQIKKTLPATMRGLKQAAERA